MGENLNINDLITLAKTARKKSYSPYSKFATGAVLVTTTGQVFTACNIENVSYGLSNCAERTAVFKAVSAGYTSFKTLLVLADTEKPLSPCGACRQVLSEFGQDTTIIMANIKGETREMTVKELLPESFKREDLTDEI